MKKSNRRWIIGLIILCVAGGLAFLSAPLGNHLKRGSTYSRSPDGYGAWYQFMREQGQPVERWQKPPERLDRLESKITLLRVGSQLSPYGQGYIPPDWLAAGNVLVELGIETPVTDAPFTTLHPTASGEVKIETRRRFAVKKAAAAPTVEADAVTPLLQDNYGVMVRRRKVDKGQHIEVITPHLAANAYQSESGNFNYLKSLVTEPGLPIYVDEFMHGYQDEETLAQEGNRSWIDYLAGTPWRAVLMQGMMVGLVLLWGLNRRLGAPALLKVPEMDNSRIYMDALSAVLMRAGCTEFVIELLQQAEQRYLQRQLGLGDEWLELDNFAVLWEQSTGHPAADLIRVLGLTPQRLSDKELANWLAQIQDLRAKVGLEKS
ncbi:MAG: DUF4350 domain-containing protein [Gloeomargarita sp. DG_2_bins_126]